MLNEANRCTSLHARQTDPCHAGCCVRMDYYCCILAAQPPAGSLENATTRQGWQILTEITAWISIYIPSFTWNVITHPCLNLTEITVWISIYTHNFMWNVITHPCPTFNGGFTKPPLKLGHGWVITSHMKLGMYRKVSNIRRTKSQNLNASRLILSLSLPNPLKPGVKLRMKMWLEQLRQVMLQLHLSYQQFNCLLKCVLYETWR